MAGKMDSLKTPDLSSLDKEQTVNLSARGVTGRADDGSGKAISDFSHVSQSGKEFAAQPKAATPPEEQEIFEGFTTKSARDAKKRGQTVDHLDQGVLVNGSYVARRTIIRFLLVLTGLVAFVIFFIPPVYHPNDKESSCRYEDIFAEKGASQFKTDILSRGYVYNIEAMTSDVSASYRICTVAFDVNNFLPLPVNIKDYAVSNGGEFGDHIVYAYADSDAKFIDAFEKETIYVHILINKAGLSDGEFDRAITSLTLTTKGMKKLGVVPCIPAVMHVSDVISFDPDVI